MYVRVWNPVDTDPSRSCRSEIPGVLLSIVQRRDGLLECLLLDSLASVPGKALTFPGRCCGSSVP